jgi:signal transduction histidine kinase
MSDPEIQKAFEEQNSRDYIRSAVFGSIVSIPLNLSCSVMDYYMYPDYMWGFFKLRVLCGLLTALVWVWFKSPRPCHRRIFGVTWFIGPLMMILWMIYTLPDPLSPYYAGLNIILLAMGLISPWTYKQNLFITVFVLAMYVVVSFARPVVQPLPYILNNTTFLFLTAAFVVMGSVNNFRRRYQEFVLRWELDRNRREMENANQKLLEMDQMKGRFYANVSHELRTPLTLLVAPIESLLRRFSLDEETRGILHTMQANGLRLLKLINDMLVLIRLESGRMEVSEDHVDLPEFVRAILSAVRHVAHDKRLRLEPFVDPALETVVVDRDKLDKIILNLVFNAIKFTPSGGSVELRAEKHGEQFTLSVIDTGMGISAKNLENVFSRFWQADDSAKRKFQGMGIGLALVKELVEVQGGSVSVQSTEGKGTTFTVTLPYRKANPAEKLAALAEPVVAADSDNGNVGSEEWLANLYRRAELFPALTPRLESGRPREVVANGTRPTLLVADDEPDMLRFLKSQLSPRYQIIEAVDGQQAVDKAKQLLPDIILLDMMMPEKDGLQACQEIRNHGATQSIPIVLLTARADEETKLAALKAGASDFLPKPFSTTELHVRIRNLVESHEYQRKLARQNQTLESTIEQLKETETQLVQTEKLASLGRLSAGLIHEINNPLNFAATGLFTLRKKSQSLAPEHQEAYAEILKDVEDGISRVKNIVSDLRTFSHPENESRDQVEVVEVVGSALRFVSNEWKDRVQIEQNLAEHQTIWANKNRLIQVLVNLLQNALDAVKRKTYENEKPTLWLESRVERGLSILVIRDNGIGIEPKVLDKIFDPFFTTKDVGEGMGLGLAICYRIVQDYDGHINVRTEPGKFCEFTLEFPAK